MIEERTHSPHLERWFDYTKSHDLDDLAAQLHEHVVFISPVVHTPQRGKAITLAYLGAAFQTLGNPSFKYVRTFDCDRRAVLEFETVMDGVQVNGVDIIEWDDEGLITEFKVMVRPLKGMQAVHAAMGRMLEAQKRPATQQA